VHRSQTLVERRELRAPAAREPREVGVGHLVMTNHPRHRHLVVAQVIAPCQEVAADIGDVAGHELAQRSPFKPSSIAAAHHAPPSDRLGRAAESRLLAPVVIPSVAPPGDRYLGAGVAENHLDNICCLHANRRAGTQAWRCRRGHTPRNAMRWVAMADDLMMLIGPAADGAPLEIGVLDIDGDDPVVIHAMTLRRKFYKFLG